MCVFRHTNNIEKNALVAEEKQGRFTNNSTLLCKTFPTTNIRLNACGMNGAKMKGPLGSLLIWCE